jgi:hypothetical protein
MGVAATSGIFDCRLCRSAAAMSDLKITSKTESEKISTLSSRFNGII